MSRRPQIAIALIVLAAAACGGKAERAERVPETRPCGTLDVGIGWRVRASPNVRCSSARRLIGTAFSRGANSRRRTVVGGYVCTTRDLADAEHVGCKRGTKLVTATSLGY